MTAALIIHGDIFEYITNHICFYDYDKLKMVSVKFNDIFNLNSKNYYEMMRIKGCNIINVIESRVMNKYRPGIPSKRKIIDKSLLYDYWYYNQYPAISKCFTRMVELKCGICVEHLIGLLYNSEYMNHRNVVNIFESVSKHIGQYPLNAIIGDFIKVCCKILYIRCNYDYKFKSSHKHIVYKTNIIIYVYVLVKAFHISTIANNDLDYSKFNRLFSIANNKLDEYKYCLKTDPIFPKIFPKYYLKCIINLIDDSYIQHKI